MAKSSALDKICSADEAAAILGLTPERVMQFLRADPPRLEGRKIGRDWVVLLDSVREFSAIPRNPGPKSNCRKDLKIVRKLAKSSR